MIGRILCPVDFSPFSERALQFGGAFAAWFGAELTVIWVQSGGWRGHGAGHTLDDGGQTLQSFTASVLGSRSVHVLTTRGPVVPEIVRAAATVDLIVMGTHGATGLERLLVGSVAEKVLRKAPCPVITVPRLAPPASRADLALETILCAVDFSPSSTQALKYALSLAETAHGRLLLLHALEWFAEEDDEAAPSANGAAFPTSEQDALAQLEELVPSDARSQCDAEALVGYGNPALEVLRVAAEQRADLIVLGVQGRGALDLTLFGSTAQQVVRDATCPVLTVKPEPG
jgi:nucleotide-binding universal stress UspA family protein